MKNISISIILFLFFVGFFFSSCKKCVTCTSTKNGQTQATQQYCNKKKFNNIWSAAFIEDAKSKGFTAVCTSE